MTTCHSTFHSLATTTSGSLHFPALLPKHFHGFHRRTELKPVASKRHNLISNCSGKWTGFTEPGWWTLPDHEETRPGSTKPVRASFVVLRMWELIGDDRWIVFVAFGALIVAAISEISMPGILTASIFAAQRGETTTFYRNSKILVFLCLISGICSGIRSGCFAVANVILVRRLKESLYAVIILQDISFFDRKSVGDLTSRLGADCQRLSNVIGNDINLILRNILQGTGALVNLLMLSWSLALSAVAICSVLSTVFLVYARYQKKAARLTQDFTAGANEVAQQAFSLMRTVRIYGAEKIEQERFKHWLDKIAFIGIRESAAYATWNLNFMTLYRLTQVSAVILGGMSIMRGHLSPEQLTKYVLYCEWLIYATWRVTDTVLSLVQSVGSSEEVFHLMNLVPSSSTLSKGMKMQRILGHVQFVDVSFCYPLRPKVLVLDQVNFSVQANEFIAIVGPSGSGKSTLINLLLHLYKPISGQIYVDSFPLKELDIRWLRAKIGFVEQLLSGGQKQRIAIARAILRDPSILILDEATSALDSESEHYVKEVVHELRNDKRAKRTVIVIAHRFSTIKTADRIVVMDNGRVIEIGSHTQLIQNNGLYAMLYRAQTDCLA